MSQLHMFELSSFVTDKRSFPCSIRIGRAIKRGVIHQGPVCLAAPESSGVQYKGSICTVQGREHVTRIKGILTKSYVKGGDEEKEES